MNSPRSIFTASSKRSKTPPPAIGPLKAANAIRRSSTPEHGFRPGHPGSFSLGLVESASSSRHRKTTSSTHDRFQKLIWKSGSGSEEEKASLQLESSVSATNVPISGTLASTPPVRGRKRPLPPDFPKLPLAVEQNTSKKSRGLIRPRHTLDPSTFPPARGANIQPPSPLFFSNNPRPRPFLPPRFSSGDAEVAMLKSTSMEDRGGVRTVKMARGSINPGSSPPRATSIPIGSFSSPRSSLATSNGPTPDESVPASNLQALSQVGIVELLERDERPTFILDLSNQLNYQPGRLQIMFANSALKAYTGLLDMLTGKLVEDVPSLATTTTFSEFKAWTISFVKNDESLDVCLPAFLYGGVTWTCSTLRKRFRFISGSQTNGPSSINSNPPSVGTPGLPSFGKGHVGNYFNAESDFESRQEEPLDYFGNAQVPVATETVNSVNSSLLSTMKTPSGHSPLSNGYDQTPQPESSAVNDRTPPSRFNTEENSVSPGTVGRTDAFHIPTTMDHGFFDWTRLPISSALPRHIQFARSVDWASTSLGPIEKWPSDLRGMCNLIMASPHPAAMYWGNEFIAIYNEPYILLAGQKHPHLMGQSYKVAWAEIWYAVEDVFANAVLTGQSTMKDDDCLFMKRNGYLEETYFSWSIIPLVGEDGSVVGLYNPAFEKTRRKIAERRMLTLRDVGEKTATAREIKGFWTQVLKGLESNTLDTPFVLLYSVTEEVDSDVSSIHSASNTGNKQCILEGTLPKVPDGHIAAPTQIDLKYGTEGFGPSFREAMATDKTILLEAEKGTLNEEMIKGLEWRGFGEAPRAAVVCPIHPTLGDGNSILGFLVMGINPRRPYDDDYDLFVQLLSRQLATSMASVVLFEEEIRRGQRAARMAALDRIELSEQLAIRTKEAVESETKFTRMAEFAPVGMFIANSEGQITYCNDMFYEISRHPKEIDNADEWMQAIKDEDRELTLQWWTNLVVNKVPMTAEFRFKTPWEDRSGSRGDTWVLASAYPEKYENGTLKSVFGSITNISQQKWAEDFQKRRMEEAMELKRQQERFIDTTSHEMRNPLSAIVQCADEISTSLTYYKANTMESQIPIDMIDSNIEAAQTIALCANHQTRIVTDILTLSKLDSALLLVTPVDTRPVAIVHQTLKMFQGELQTSDIQMEIKTDASWDNSRIDWVKLDPSRLLQVLINLTTNAIKFTTGQPERRITITLSALSERPLRNANSQFSYIPARSKRKETREGAEWGTGEEVFIHFAVQDTGRGLNDSEKKLLFLRFSQANPRTHVQYGGSGLGLFISRELVELQGGEIGVSSQSGKGSTFAFYVKARKTAAPMEEHDEQGVEPFHSTKVSSEKIAVTSQTIKASRPSDFQSEPIAPSTSELRVLIVEDNLVNQRVLQKQLRNLGCTVYVANHGGECIDRLKESRFWIDHEDHGLQLNVILMDLEMPVMDGLTCARKIRELQRKGDIVRHVPIIAVTANARLEQINDALEAGMDDVVSKPFRIPELIPKIEQLVLKFIDVNHRPVSPQ